MNVFSSIDSRKSDGIFGVSPELVLWALFFCYSTLTALLAQKLLLPLLPSIHAGNGLLNHDAELFHAAAVLLAQSIRDHGWSSWAWAPASGIPGNVAILGALYAVFGNDPSAIIPVNASLHAMAGVLIFLLGRELWPGRVGFIGGLVAATLFVGFPSSLTWFGQIHKDSYAITGLLLILYSWVRLTRVADTWRGLPAFAISHLIAVILIGFVRPYFLKVVFAGGLCLLAALIYMVMTRTALRGRWKAVGYGLVAAIVMGIGAWSSGKVISSDSTYATWEAGGGYARSWKWHSNPLIPYGLEKYIETAAKIRAGLIDFGLSEQAGSMVDADVTPDNVAAVLAYAPRALQIALFAPFPSTWGDKPSLMRLVGVGETLIWYLLVPGVLMAIYRRRSTGLFFCFLYGFFFLYVLGFVNANVGTLYRFRYPFLFIFVLVGTMGWADFILRRFAVHIEKLKIFDSGSADDRAEHAAPAGHIAQSRSGMAAASFWVIALTTIGYAGFFLRDVILTKQFGIRGDVDVFYFSVMIPMFFVSVFAMPIGAACTPALLAAKSTGGESEFCRLVGGLAFLGTLPFVFLGVVMCAGGAFLLPFLGAAFDAEKTHKAVVMLAWVSPILMLSGINVIGNAILNALKKPHVSAGAQIVVPVCAIFALAVFGNSLGVTSVALGMVVGLIANLLIVAFYLKAEGIPLIPRPNRAAKVVLAEYSWLVVAALTANLMVPINYVFALFSHEGGVAAWAIGSKVVFFLTGVIAVVMTSIMLPYFSSIIATRRPRHASPELSFFLMLGTLISIIVAIAIFSASHWMIRIAFESSNFDASDTELVGRVVRYGIVQLPFIVCNVLCVTFAIASKRSWQVVLASLIGVVINVLLDYVLVKGMGVAGISLATAIAGAVSTSILLVTAHAFKGAQLIDIASLVFSWLLFLTLILCLHYESYPGVAVASLSLIIMFSTFWQTRRGLGLRAA